jgi:Meckel syndrome type 1 protein
VATVGAPKAESEKKAIQRSETTKLPPPAPAKPATSKAPAPATVKLAPPVTAKPSKPVTEEDKRNAAAETAVEGLEVELAPEPPAPPAPAAKKAPAPVPPHETDPEIEEAPTTAPEQKPALLSKPTVVIKGDPRIAEAKPAVVSPPTSRHLTVDDDPEALLEHLQKKMREAKSALSERDEARNRVAALEHEVAQAGERARELQAKVDETVKMNRTLIDDNAKLQKQIEALETKVKQLDERATKSETTVKKQDNALSNAKEARDEAQWRVDAALAVLQGKPIPPKPEKK